MNNTHLLRRVDFAKSNIYDVISELIAEIEELELEIDNLMKKISEIKND